MSEPFFLPYLPARSQGDHPECNAFATVAAMESWVLAHASGLRPHLPLSEKDLWQLDPKDNLQRVLKAAATAGVVEEGASHDRRRMEPNARRQQPALFWRARFKLLDASQMAEAIKAGHPLVTSIYIDDEFAAYDGSAPYTRKREPARLPAHAISIIGFHWAERLWIAKNSLGPDWGMRGGCFTFRFGDKWLKAEHNVWYVDAVDPPNFR